jgi:hypothetical protein
MRTREEIIKHLSYYTKAMISECGIRVATLLEEWQGLHHIPEEAIKKCEWDNDRYIVVRASKYDIASQLSTFDFDMLTQLVFLAHDHCIRVDISPLNPQFLNLTFFPRQERTGGMSQRHPTVESALDRWRLTHQTSFVVPTKEFMEVQP